MNKYPTTPDGRYFVVKKRLWRCTDPTLEEQQRRRLVKKLMEARRGVKEALKTDAPEALKTAREKVQKAKVQLGERGPVWWSDGAPDYNQKAVQNTPYADWFEGLPE